MRWPGDCGQMNVAQRRAYRMYLWGTLIYVFAILIAFYLFKLFHSWPGKPVFMVLPFASVVFMLRAMMLYFSAADEMQRRILSESCAYAFVTTVFASIVCGLFEGTLIPPIPWYYRFSFMMFVWGIAVQLTKRRYK